MVDFGFGSDGGQPDYAAIAQLVSKMEPRALTSDALPDVRGNLRANDRVSEGEPP